MPDPSLENVFAFLSKASGETLTERLSVAEVPAPLDVARKIVEARIELGAIHKPADLAPFLTETEIGRVLKALQPLSGGEVWINPVPGPVSPVVEVPVETVPVGPAETLPGGSEVAIDGPPSEVVEELPGTAPDPSLAEIFITPDGPFLAASPLFPSAGSPVQLNSDIRDAAPWPRLAEVARPVGLWVCGLPAHWWWGPADDRREPPPAEGAADRRPAAPGGPVSVDEPDMEERKVIDRAADLADQEKKKQDEEARKKLEEKKKKAEKRRQRARDQKERRDKDKKYRERRERQDRLDDERRRLDDRWKEQQDERKRLEDDQKRIDQDRDRLRKEEQQLRDGPPPDPNCNSVECRNKQTERVQNNRDNVKNQQDAQKNFRDGIDVRNQERSWQQDNAQFQDALDHGFGQNAEEFKEHKLLREAQDLQQRLNDVNRRLGALNEIAKDRPLSPAEEQERRSLQDASKAGEARLEANEARGEVSRLSQEIDRLSKAPLDANETNEDRQKKLTDLDRQRNALKDTVNNSLRDQLDRQMIKTELGKDLDPSNMNYGREFDEARQEAREARAINGMSDANLDKFIDASDNAIGEMERVIDGVGKPGRHAALDMGRLGDYEEAQRKLSDAQDRLNGLGNQFRGLREGLDSLYAQKEAVRDRLARMGASPNDFTVPGSLTPEQVDEIKSLREQFRVLEAAEGRMGQDLRGVAAQRRAAQSGARDAQAGSFLAQPGAEAEAMALDQEGRNRALAPFYDDQGNFQRAKAQDEALRMLRGLERWEGLNQQRDRLDRGLDADGKRSLKDMNDAPAPGESVVERRARRDKVQQDIDETERNLEGSGFTRKLGDGWAYDPSHLIASGLAGSINEYNNKRKEEQKAKDAAAGQPPRDPQALQAQVEGDRRSPRLETVSPDDAKARALDQAVQNVDRTIQSYKDMGGPGAAVAQGLEGMRIALVQARAALVSPAATTVREDVKKFVEDTFQVPDAGEHPLTQVLVELAPRVGVETVRRFVQSHSAGPVKTTPVEVIQDFFDHLIGEAAEQGDHAGAVRLQERKVAALARFRSFFAPKPGPRSGTSSKETESVPFNPALIPWTLFFVQFDAAIAQSQVQALLHLAESYRRLAARAERAGRREYAALFQAHARAADARARALAGQTVDMDELAGQVEEATRSVLEEALLAGDAETAELILTGRLDALTSALQALPQEKQGRASTGAHERIAKDAEDLARVYRAQAEKLDGGEKQAKLEQASRMDLLAAQHLVKGGNLFHAALQLDGIKVGNNKALNDWKVAIIIEGLSQLDPALQPPSGTASGGTDFERRDQRLMRDRFLDLLASSTDDPAMKATAYLSRAELAESFGSPVLAREFRQKAAQAAPRHPAVIQSELTQLFKQGLSSDVLRQFVDVLVRVPDSMTPAAVDAQVITRVLQSNPTDAQWREFEQMLQGSALPEDRKSLLLLLVGLKVTYTAAQAFGSTQEVLQRTQALRGLIDKTTLADAQKQAYRDLLGQLAQPAETYAQAKAKFNAGQVPPDQMLVLFGTAVGQGDQDLAERVIDRLAQSVEGLDAAQRLNFFSEIAEQLAAVMRLSKDAAQKQMLSALIGRLKKAGEGLGDEEIAQERNRLRTGLRDLRDSKAAVDEGGGNFAYPALFFFLGGPALGPLYAAAAIYYQKEKDKAYYDAVDKTDSLDAARRRSMERIRALSRAQMRLRLAGLNPDEAARVSAEAVQEASSTLGRREAEAKAAAEGVANNGDLQDTLPELDRWRAQSSAARAVLHGRVDAAIAAAPLATETPGALSGPRFSSALEQELHRLGLDLNGGRPGTGLWLKEEPGLRRKAEAFATYEILYRREGKKNEYGWKRALLEDELRDIEERRRSLAVSDLPTDASGRPPAPGAGLLRLHDILEQDLRLFLARSGQYSSQGIDVFTGAGSREARRAQGLRAYMESVPELRAIRILGERGKQMEWRELYRTLGTALTQIGDQHAHDFAEYVDTPFYKLGLQQMWNLFAPDFLNDDPRAQGYSATMARLQKYRADADALSRALRDAADGKALAPDQKELLARFGFLVRDAQGNEQFSIPATLSTTTLDARLNLPTRTAWDELINPLNMLKLAAVILIPGALSAGGAGFLTKTLLLDEIIGGTLVRVAAEAYFFTYLSRSSTILFENATGTVPQGPRAGFLDEYVHNLGIFAALGLLGNLGKLAPSERELLSRLGPFQWSPGAARLATYANTAALFAAETGLFTALELAGSGEDLSLDVVLRQVLTLLALKAGHGAMDAVKRRAFSPRPEPTAPVSSRPGTETPAYREIRDRLAPIETRVRAGSPEAPVLSSPDWPALADQLKQAGVRVVEHARPFRRDRAWVRLAPDGVWEIHLDKNSLRVDLYNELGKIQEATRLGVDIHTPFTSELQAQIEYFSYSRAEREVFQGLPASPRKRESQLMALFWLGRLRKIQSGRWPNRVLFRPLEGFTLGVTRDPYVQRFKQWFEEQIKLLSDPRVPDVYKTLSAAAKKTVDRLSDWIDKAHLRVFVLKGRQGRILKQLEDPSLSSVKRKELTEELSSIEDKIDKEERILLGHYEDLEVAAEGVSREVTIKAQTFKEPTFVDQTQREVYDDQLNPTLFEPLRRDYEILHKRSLQLEADLEAAVAAGDAAAVEAIRAERKTNRQARIDISRRLGGAGGRSLQRFLPRLKKIFGDDTGGGPSGEVDAVYVDEVTGRTVIGEEKGGQAWVRTAQVEGEVAEQGTTAYARRTLYIMWERGEELKKSDVPEERERGQLMSEAAQRGLRDLQNGTLDYYIISTDWIIDKTTGDVRVGPTEIYKAILEGTDVPRPLSGERLLPVREPSKPEPDPGEVRLGRVMLPEGRSVAIRSDGVHADVPAEFMDALVDNIRQAARRPGVRLVSLPEGTLIILRSDAPKDLDALLNDPAFDALKKVAREREVDISIGVYWKDSLAGPPGSTVVLIGRDGSVRLPGWTQDLLPTHNPRLLIDGVPFAFPVVGDLPGFPRGPGIHIITAASRPEAYEAALASLDRALAVNWQGPAHGPVAGIDFIDVPRRGP